ncbi:transporter substrate-binding domain-containing protein [Vibrio europaeus]|uniref:substrate-binding periplasmic protein n=1 Tax=Vibrio europaeus TaxID=300876 RepID=UPI00233EB557|nr:transporter substrate-binding domain-containing protein [Vibrio europaeus]MDC5818598.1 transporter substrate-binding domain-containing protein [Vibrio europaeus]MDC5871379.1 transporter substrate-binding domain-containing protein [Vibrio europaeus]
MTRQSGKFGNIAIGWIALVWGTASLAEPIQLDLYTQEFPPLQVQVDQQAEGYVVKFVEAVVEHASQSLPMEVANVHFAPWKRAIRNTQENENTLFFSLSRTPSRELEYQWIGPVSPYEVAIYRHFDGPNVSPNSFQDLKNFSFAAQTASNFEEMAREEGFTNIIPVNYGKVAIKLLRAHRVDFAPLVTSSYHYRMEQYGYDPKEFVEVVKVDKLCKELWLVTGNKTSQQVVEALRDSFYELKNQGKLADLMQQYQPDSEIMVRYRNAMK